MPRLQHDTSSRRPGLMLITLLACAGCDDERDSTSPEDSLREAKIGMTEAIAAAEREVGEGITVEAEFEQSRDGALFEVEILVGDDVREVFVDPSDGRVLRVTSDPEDLAEARAFAAWLGGFELSLTEAIAIAERETEGVVFEVEPNEAGFELGVLTNGGAIELIVGQDGQVVARAQGEGPELEDDDDDDDDDDD